MFRSKVEKHKWVLMWPKAMEESALAEREELATDLIQAEEIRESTKKKLVETKEESHTERTEETTEKLIDNTSTLEEEKTSNEVCDNPIQINADEAPTQIAAKESSPFENSPTEVESHDETITENCHEVQSGQNNVSEVANLDSECVKALQISATNEEQSLKNRPIEQVAPDQPVCDVVSPEEVIDTQIERSQEDVVETTCAETVHQEVEIEQPGEPNTEPTETSEELQENQVLQSDPQQETKEDIGITTTEGTTRETTEQKTAEEQEPEVTVEATQVVQQIEEVQKETEIVQVPTSEEAAVAPAEVYQPSTGPEPQEIVFQPENPTMHKPNQQERPLEIQKENLKNQLEEIIQEIDREVDKKDQEEEYPEPTEPTGHTWKPRKKYEVPKTEVQYEDVVPIRVPEVNFTERKIQAALQQEQMNGEDAPQIEIPQGVPLLAKMIPKEGSDDTGKIPLERLFTPATDSSDDLTPKKRKIYASSAFYRPDHPTIEDQVDLAHKISVSLIDDQNKASKGHNMYMKRKNRSSKWIHAADEVEEPAGEFISEEDLLPPKESKQRPPLKLLMNPKGLHDYTSIQQTYEEMTSEAQMSPQAMNNIEGTKEIIHDMQSPTTGKGAALFAKRKKRMDKFIVDENSIQKQAIVSKTTTQESSFRSSHQEETQMFTNTSSYPVIPPAIESSSAGSLILPDITKILTKPSDKKTLVKTRSKPNAKKEYSWNISTKKETTSSSSKTPSSKNIHGFHTVYSSSSNSNTDHYTDLRPGTPPMFVVSDKQGNLVDKTAHFKIMSGSTNEAQDHPDSGISSKAVAYQRSNTNARYNPKFAKSGPIMYYGISSMKDADTVYPRQNLTQMSGLSLSKSQTALHLTAPSSASYQITTYNALPRPYKRSHFNNSNRRMTMPSFPAMHEFSLNLTNNINQHVSKTNRTRTTSSSSSSSDDSSTKSSSDDTKLVDFSSSKLVKGKEKRESIKNKVNYFQNVFKSTSSNLEKPKDSSLYSTSESFHPSGPQRRSFVSENNHTFTQNIELSLPSQKKSYVTTTKVEHSPKGKNYSSKYVKEVYQPSPLIVKALPIKVTYNRPRYINDLKGREDNTCFSKNVSVNSIHEANQSNCGCPQRLTDKINSLINQSEMGRYISEVENSFCFSPSYVESVNIREQKPPEFYTSVSRYVECPKIDVIDKSKGSTNEVKTIHFRKKGKAFTTTDYSSDVGRKIQTSQRPKSTSSIVLRGYNRTGLRNSTNFDFEFLNEQPRNFSSAENSLFKMYHNDKSHWEQKRPIRSQLTKVLSTSTPHLNSIRSIECNKRVVRSTQLR